MPPPPSFISAKVIGGFAAPAASDFLDAQKVTKKAPGGGRNRLFGRASRLHAARPLEPPLRGVPLGVGKAFPVRKTGVASAIYSGPLGPGFAKIAAVAVYRLPGFAEPSLLVRIRTGGPRASPTQIKNRFWKPVGEGLAPPADSHRTTWAPPQQRRC